MRVLICGGANYNRVHVIRHNLDRLHAEHKFTCVITGGAPGADTHANEWAISRGIQDIVVPAQWDRFGLRAGPIRNSEMLKLSPDLVVAFPGAKGTADMTRKARAAGVTVIEIVSDRIAME